jgi:polyadenylation factor subunit 2
MFYFGLCLCCFAAVAWHPVHPLLVSGGSEGAILHWDLSTPEENSFTSAVSPPRATLSQAHDSNVWSLAYHPFGHILVSASNDHTTRFWSRERPGDASSVFSGGGEKPPEIVDMAGQEEEDDAMVPGFGFGGGNVPGGGAPWWVKDEDGSGDIGLRRAGPSDVVDVDDFVLPGLGSSAPPPRQNGYPSSAMHQDGPNYGGGEKDEFGRDREPGRLGVGGGGNEDWGRGAGGSGFNRGARYGPRRGRY